MSTNDRGPVSMMLVGGAAAIVLAAMLAYQCFGTPLLGSLCSTWLLLPLVLG